MANRFPSRMRSFGPTGERTSWKTRRCCQRNAQNIFHSLFLDLAGIVVSTYPPNTLFIANFMDTHFEPCIPIILSNFPQYFNHLQLHSNHFLFKIPFPNYPSEEECAEDEEGKVYVKEDSSSSSSSSTAAITTAHPASALAPTAALVPPPAPAASPAPSLAGAHVPAPALALAPDPASAPTQAPVSAPDPVPAPAPARAPAPALAPPPASSSSLALASKGKKRSWKEMAKTLQPETTTGRLVRIRRPSQKLADTLQQKQEKKRMRSEVCDGKVERNGRGKADGKGIEKEEEGKAIEKEGEKEEEEEGEEEDESDDG